jgi:hypothetical protein
VANALSDDTRRVREEFDGLSTPTQVFVAVLVALGILLGLVLGGFVGYGVAVEEVEGRDCIEHDDRLFCAENGAEEEAADEAEEDEGD